VNGTLRLVPVLLVAVALGGCGEQTAEEKAHQDRDRQLAAWDNREGTAWAAYAKGWNAAWQDACVRIDQKFEPDLPTKGLGADCGLAPEIDDELGPFVPTYPPDSPNRRDGTTGSKQAAKTNSAPCERTRPLRQTSVRH
jgi:hypothetical protein